MKHLFELIVEIGLETGFWFFVDVIFGRVSMELLILALFNMLIISSIGIRQAIKEKEKVMPNFFLGLFIGMLVIFAVMSVFRIVYFIMSEIFGLSIQPNDQETKRWYALVNAVMVTVSPLVFLAKIKNRWKRLFLSLIHVPFFLVVYWAVASLWKPEVQVGIEIQLVMSVSLTLGLYLWFSPKERKRKKKVIVGTENLQKKREYKDHDKIPAV